MKQKRCNFTGRRTHRFGILSFFLTCFAFAVVMIPRHAAAATYYVSGEVDAGVYWSVSQGMAHDTNEVLPEWEQTNMILSAELTGPGGNAAEATAVASLPIGILSAFGSGITPENEAGIPGIGVGVATSRFQDVLTFVVPPGTYDEAVIARVRGSVRGFFAVTGNGSPSGYAHFSAAFGAANSVGWSWYDEDGAVYQKFELSRPLVSAGATLTDARVVKVYVKALLSVRGQSSGGHVSSGLADFSHSAFFNVIVPEYVAWSSDSGIFLSQAVALCEGGFDDDHDVDGLDLALYISDAMGVGLEDFATDFGRADCP